MSGTFDTKWRPKQIQPVPDLTKENFKQTESRNLPADFGLGLPCHLLSTYLQALEVTRLKRLSVSKGAH